MLGPAPVGPNMPPGMVKNPLTPQEQQQRIKTADSLKDEAASLCMSGSYGEAVKKYHAAFQSLSTVDSRDLAFGFRLMWAATGGAIAAYHDTKYKEAMQLFSIVVTTFKQLSDDNPLVYFYIGSAMSKLKVPKDGYQQYLMRAFRGGGSRLFIDHNSGIAATEPFPKHANNLLNEWNLLADAPNFPPPPTFKSWADFNMSGREVAGQRMDTLNECRDGFLLSLITKKYSRGPPFPPLIQQQQQMQAALQQQMQQQQNKQPTDASSPSSSSSSASSSSSSATSPTSSSSSSSSSAPSSS